jgi:peptide/nickel transport system permease protein
MSASATADMAGEPSLLRQYARRFAEDRVALAALGLFALLVLIALVAPWISPQNPYDLKQLDILDSDLPPGSPVGASSGRHYLLGTDGQGRDLLSAIVYGLRISIGVGLACWPARSGRWWASLRPTAAAVPMRC